MTYSELMQIVFATYDTLARNFKQYDNDGLFASEFCWCRVILEEAHCIRNRGAERTKSSVRLVGRSLTDSEYGSYPATYSPCNRVQISFKNFLAYEIQPVLALVNCVNPKERIID